MKVIPESDRYIIKADVEKFDNTAASVVIYFNDTDKYDYYGDNNVSRGITNDDTIYRFEVIYSDHIKIGDEIKQATLVGFNLDTGVVIQVVDSGNTVNHITAVLGEKAKDIIKPYIAKAMLINK